MSDPVAQPGTTTTCLITSNPTTCLFAATGEVAGPVTYTWTATYQYGTTVTHTQSGTSPNFSFTQTCGGSGATATGTEVPLNVTLTVADTLGTTTLQSGSGNQPALTIKFFTCS